ncbi:transglycosylase family protein [Cellulomonas wangleii]|uniref:transglycosylase family protein n=1 Tax=Cellulomonas wangleii TaxID=2816956 RepID=UPI0027DCACE2|nr:transglycosylase family protein [Cellulomonas wangleii]
MPGIDDAWSLVQFFARPTGNTPPAAHAATPDAPQDAAPENHRRRRRWPLVAAGTAALVVAAGGTAYAQAHKTVALDVDGEVTRVSTFAGSVEGLLEDHGIELGQRDTVSHSGALTDGTEIVVRTASAILVALNGTPEVVWTTALTADEALDTLAARADSVALLASRSAQRTDLPMELALGDEAEVLVDGAVHPVPDADATVNDALTDLDVSLQPLDRVTVQQGEQDVVQVVVQRVAEQDVTTQSEVPFTSRTEEDPTRYTGEKVVAQAGVPGVRSIVERVTTVDGVESGRVALSDVTQPPVEEVVRVGTKARPVAPPAPRPSAPSSSGSSAAPGPITAGGSADSLNWAALARCESGGRVDAVSSTGKYHGLYQFSVATWQAVGGSGLPSQASAEEQTARAKMLYNRAGAGQWPHCGKNLFS